MGSRWRQISVLFLVLTWRAAVPNAAQAQYLDPRAALARPAAAAQGPAWNQPVQAAYAVEAPEVRRLPPLEPNWSGDGRIAGPGPVDGQPVGFAPPDDNRAAVNSLAAPAPSPFGVLPVQVAQNVPNSGQIVPGVVHGRLADRGRPLVNCQVVLVPMHEEEGVFCFDQDRKVLASVTDEQGQYYFENVPPGGYKLTWLPQGQNRWIRRLAMSPDVKVRSGETTQPKDIRVALHTIN